MTIKLGFYQLASLMVAFFSVPIRAAVTDAMNEAIQPKVESSCLISEAPVISIDAPNVSNPIANQTTKAPDNTLSLRSRAMSVLFGPGTFELSDQGLLKIRQLAEFLQSNLNFKVLLIGRTPNSGSREYSVAISKKYTAAVASELKRLNLRATRILELPMGKHDDRDLLCVTDACDRASGSVEILIQK